MDTWKSRQGKQWGHKQNVRWIQAELNKKGEKTGKALGKHVINLYSNSISWMGKIRDVHKLRQDIENDRESWKWLKKDLYSKCALYFDI